MAEALEVSEVLEGGSLEETDLNLSRESALPDSLEGTTIGLDGRYKILQRIGEGGFGTVYMADQTAPVRRRVAVKVLKAGMDTRQVVARFEAERQALAMMDHPNIARIIDGGETDQGRPFFVMELVRGIPITAFCDEENLGTRQRLQLFMKVCGAVQHAHQKGVIHRDLKPGNILVTVEDGAEPVPKVIDFGVAKAAETQLTDKTLFTRFEQMIGTPAYMSPEQAGARAAHDIDTRADIYALGVLLYELLTGTTPIESATLKGAAFDEVRRILREDEAPRPSARLSSLELDRRTTIAKSRATESATLGKQLRGDLDWIVMKAIEKDRRRRYDTANALADDVERHLEDEPVSAGPPTAAYRTGKFLRRHKGTAGVVAAMLLLLVAGIVATSWQAIRATAEKRRATEERQRAVEAEALAEERQKEAEAISKFITGMFESAKPGSEEGGRTITVEESLKIAEKKLEEDEEMPSERRAILQEAIGIVYESLGRPHDFVRLQEKVHRFYLENYGFEHPGSLRAMTSLAISYAGAGRKEEALELFEEVLALYRKVFDPEHPDTLTAMRNLAISYSETGGKQEALELREEVLALCRKVFDPEHPATLAKMSNLAVSYAETNRKGEALELREEVLALHRKVLGPEHPDTLMAMRNLAYSYAETDRKQDALEMREEVLALRRKVSGPEHPDTLTAMNDLAISYAESDRKEEALEMREDVLAMRRKVSGPEHPDTLSAMNDLAISYAESDRKEEALEMREDVLAMRRKVSGPEHPYTLTAMANLAVSYGWTDRKQEALEMCEEVLALRRKVLGPEHLDTLDAMNNLGNSYHGNGRNQEALEVRLEQLQLSRKINGEFHSETDRAWRLLTDAYERVNRQDELIELLEMEVERRGKEIGSEHPDTYKVMHNLADSYKKAGRQDEALALESKLLGFGNVPLAADSPAVKVVLVSPNSEWRWLHPVDGVDPAESDPDFHRRFFLADYDDSAWRSGTDSEEPTGGFGYGDKGFTGVDIGTPSAKALGKSAYFRHRFTTDEEFTNLELRCHRDDGIIVYLDGKEVARGNMSDGEEAYRLPAAGTVGGDDETTVYRLPLDDVTLPPGEHVLAISLHNTEVPSSDLRIGGITLVEVE